MRATLGVVVGAVIATLCGTAAGSPEADAPGALVVLVDRSMAADKLEGVSTALIDGLSGLGPRDQLAVVEFGEAAKVRVKLQRVKTGKAIAAKLTGFKTADHSNVIAGLRAAAGLLETSKLKSRRVLMITDDECVLGVASAVGKLRLAGITVSAVGYQALNATTVDLFASSGGGEAYMIDDGAELVPILAAQTASGTREVRVAPSAPAAVVFLIDKSGSSRGKQLDAEKELVRIAIESLADTDTIAVVGFDTEATVIERAQRLTNRRRILSSVAKIEASGGTDLEPGLKEAFALLLGMNAQIKHVYLLTDGDTNLEGLVELAIEMKVAKIMLSIVRMPGGDAVQLREIATSGGGRLLSDDPSELPKAIAETLDRVAP